MRGGRPASRPLCCPRLNCGRTRTAQIVCRPMGAHDGSRPARIPEWIPTALGLGRRVDHFLLLPDAGRRVWAWWANLAAKPLGYSRSATPTRACGTTCAAAAASPPCCGWTIDSVCVAFPPPPSVPKRTGNRTRLLIRLDRRPRRARIVSPVLRFSILTPPSRVCPPENQDKSSTAPVRV